MSDDAQLDLFSPARREKECAWCHKRKPVSEFARHRHQADGRQRVCKECLAKNWRENHAIDDSPPVPRVSAYDVIEKHLDTLEWLARNGGNVIAQIELMRAELKL